MSDKRRDVLIAVAMNGRKGTMGKHNERVIIQALTELDKLDLTEDELFYICHTAMLKNSDENSMIWFSDISWDIAKSIIAKMREKRSGE